MDFMAVAALNFSQALDAAAMCHLSDNAQDHLFCSRSEPRDDKALPVTTEQILGEQVPSELPHDLAANCLLARDAAGDEALSMVFPDQSAAVAVSNLATDPAFPITLCEAVYKKKSHAQVSDSEKQRLMGKVLDKCVPEYARAPECPAPEPAEGRGFTCSTCGGKYKRRESLKRHLLKHSGEKPFACPECSLRFCRKCQLTRHALVHTREKPHACSDCGVRFRDRGNLHTHHMVHTGERPFRCAVCGAGFRDRSNLKRHLLTHGGDKRFACVACTARFKRKGDLKTHTLTHTGEKPFSCYVCGTRFVVKSSLNKHLFTHTGEKPFKCPVCGVAFQQLRYLKRHSALHVGDQPLDFSVRTQQCLQLI